MIKLHEANRETREKLQEERDGIHQLLKTEIRARLATLGTIETTVKKTQSETERLLAAGRVEAAQALRTAEVKLSRRLTATEGRVEVEVAALRKLYARQTQLEIDLDVFKRDVVQAFEAMQEDVTVAAVAQALNTEADNVQAEYVTDTVEELQDIIETQDKRDKSTAEELKAAVFGPGPYGEPGLRDRADSTEAAVASAFDKLSQHTIELDRVRETAADDKKEVESLLEELKEEMDYNVAATMVETETLQNQLDIQAAEVAGAADMIESKLREKVSELAERNKEGIERIRAEMHLPLQNLRSAIDAEVAARVRTDGDVAKCVADRDAAVAALWTAMEANHVAHALQIECAMIDSEEFALSMADAHDANVAEEAAARNEGFERLRDHVAAAVAEEAAERRRGDDAVRRAYEDDIANLEDTAAEAVRELREGLRDEVATRTHQAETLHRDLASTLDKARSRLEADVRALEETAAGNIAAQKLEEEMLRAELDDGLLRVDEALEQLQTDADARAAEALQKLDQHRAAIAASVAEECAPVDARVTALARTVEGFDRRFDTVKTEAFEADAAVKRELVDAMESAAEETEKAFRQVHGDVAKVEAELAAAAADRVATDETTRAELEAIVSAESATRERAVRYLEEKIVDAETDAKVEAELARAELAADAEDAAEEASSRAEAAVRSLRAEMEAKDQTQAIRAEMAEAKDQTQAIRAEMAEAKDQTQAIRAEMAEAKDQTQAICAEMAERVKTEAEATRASCVAHADAAVEEVRDFAKGDGPQRGGDGGVAGGRHERGGGVGGRGKERR